MSYVGWDGREYEDVEMDNMRERPRRNTSRAIDSLERAAREMERLARVLHEEELEEAGVHVDDALVDLRGHIENLRSIQAALTPHERLRDLLG